MNAFDHLNLSDHRIQRYAHAKAWLQDIHPPYRYHIDNLDIAPVLGLGWESPWSIWSQIRSQQLAVPTLQQANKQLKWTPVLRRLFESQTGRSCDLEWRRIRHPTLEWAFASLFSCSFDPRTGDFGGVLFKISNNDEAWAADGEYIETWQRNTLLPPNIAMEAYWVMLCTGLQWIDIAVAFPSTSDFIDLRVIRIAADPDIQKGIEKSISSWRERHLIQGAPPRIDASRECSSFLMEKYRIGGNRIRNASPDEESMLQNYHQLNQQIRDLQQAQRQIRNQLFESVANDRGLQGSDGSRAIISRSRSGFQLRTFQAKKSKVS
ncbi:MAG: hypothetical protein VX278_23720 [Myxococcota bacterium]|nr:hypothetical protein [Myxococcota bacterium]